MSGAGHRVSDERLAAIAAGAIPTRDEAERILADPALRRRLAVDDPGAVFALLGGLPPEPPAPPMPLLALPARRRAGMPRSLLAAAAVLVMVAGLALVLRAPVPDREPTVAADTAPAFRVGPPASWPAAVERVQSPPAEIVALIPPSAGGPVVTLIVDEEVDL